MDNAVIHLNILTHASCQCNQHKLLQTACGKAADANFIFNSRAFKKKKQKTKSSNFILQLPIHDESMQKWKTIKILFVFSPTCNPLCGAFATAAAVNGVTTASSVLSHYCQIVTHSGYMTITAEHQTDDLFPFQINLLT